jgi:hypothetical protein
LLGIVGLLLAPTVRAVSDCSEYCKANLVFSLHVQVRDAAGAPVCDGSVVAVIGSEQIELSRSGGGDGQPCGWSGVPERRGTFTILVTSGSRTAQVDHVKVTGDDCHVHTAEVLVTLPT